MRRHKFTATPVILGKQKDGSIRSVQRPYDNAIIEVGMNTKSTRGPIEAIVKDKKAVSNMFAISDGCHIAISAIVL